MLNYLAAEFVPKKAAQDELHLPDDLFASSAPADLVSDESEEGIKQEELDELEAVDSWVEAMALCEEAEREHLIAFALEHAPPELVEQIEQRAAAVGASPKDAQRAGRKGGKAPKAPHA